MLKFTMQDVANVASEYSSKVEIPGVRYHEMFGNFNDIHFTIGNRRFAVYQNKSSFVVSEVKGRRRVALADLRSQRFTSINAFRRFLESL